MYRQVVQLCHSAMKKESDEESFKITTFGCMSDVNGTQLSRGSIAFAVGDFLELSARTGE